MAQLSTTGRQYGNYIIFKGVLEVYPRGAPWVKGEWRG
jgi:hypothetical protein